LFEQIEELFFLLFFEGLLWAAGVGIGGSKVCWRHELLFAVDNVGGDNFSICEYVGDDGIECFGEGFHGVHGGGRDAVGLGLLVCRSSG